MLSVLLTTFARSSFLLTFNSYALTSQATETVRGTAIQVALIPLSSSKMGWFDGAVVRAYALNALR